MEYRKKPVVVEAMEIQTYHDLETIAAWVNSYGGKAVCGQEDHGPAFMYINTLEGTHRADIRDFVIRGVEGEFYPCKPSIFRATYELVEE